MKRRTWPVYLAFLVAILLVIVASGVVQAIACTKMDTAAVLAIAVFVNALIMSGCAFGGAWLSSDPVVERLGLHPPRHTGVSYGSLVLASLAAPALGTFLDSATQIAGVELTGSLLFLFETIRSASPLELLVLAFMLSIGPALGEELLLRGYVQTRLAQRHGPRAGIIVSSLLFGLMHLDPLHAPLAAIMGLYLGFVRTRFASTWVSVAAHMTNNLFATLMTAYAPDFTGNSAVLALPCGSSLVIFGACLTHLLQGQKESFTP